MNAELIGLITLIFTTFGSMYKSHLDKKEGLKKLQERDKVFAKGLREVTTIVIKTRDDVEEIKINAIEDRQDNSFGRMLSSAIRSTGSQMINTNFSLTPNARNIVTFVTRQIEDLAFLFHDSPYPNDPDAMEKYLRNDIEEKKATACLFIDSAYKNIKVYKSKKYKLSTFLNDVDTLKDVDKYISCNHLMELFLLDLKGNGYDKEKTIKEFTKFLLKYLESLIKTILKFDDLDDQ